MDTNNLKESLAAARKFVTQFKDDLWEWLVDLVTDPTLADSIMWYPIEKYLHHGSKITRIYDEVNTGKQWWEIQNHLPHEHGAPHCFLPLHLWLDKGKVSRTMNMHPIVLRPAFLPTEIRNASRNCGGTFIGLIPIVGNPNDTIENEDDTPTSVELAQFKREVYHKVTHVIFRSLRKRSHHGDTLSCGDKIMRVIYPAFLIHSVDGEEGCSTCGTRGAQAKHPCPKCLAEKTALSMLSKHFTSRVQEVIIDIFRKAKKLGSSSRMALLHDSGLHFVKNTFWRINNSSPYDTYSYDLLHAFDAGEWGKHLWPLVLEVLKNDRNRISRSMHRMPCWRGLIHFNVAGEIDFTDGNSFRDILKLLPPGALLVHCIRICTILRSIAGLRVVTDEHIRAYRQFLAKYEKWCKKVTKEHGKKFNYPKHHNLIHLPEDIENKGCTENYSTRPGEGFQQEVQQAYEQTNFKNTESQITRIDENQEAIARIRMFVDLHDEELSKAMSAEDLTDGNEPPPRPVRSQDNYAVGSPLIKITIDILEHTKGNLPPYRSFRSKLHEFLESELDEDSCPRGFLTITPYQCLYLTYMSLEDWREKRDILRCNPSFHNRPQYDCVVINTNPITFARLEFIFTCEDASKRQCDIALVQTLKDSPWQPRTKWEGCRILEDNSYRFILLKYLIVGAI
ncbi:hypothetical protein M422DRAFT_249872 [Sphaerobolus stellatus SS14]|uniref:Uncharacterized protein n=1 Tax=Sphaerobolus stellatus (strain SS14) TaxID=990650 RepID=A0A0C9W3Q5_SPHS4|nr:hypothetical protein M422DRAFT_249872 [Sphaerobolus stellatus SS14]